MTEKTLDIIYNLLTIASIVLCSIAFIVVNHAMVMAVTPCDNYVCNALLLILLIAVLQEVKSLL